MVIRKPEILFHASFEMVLKELTTIVAKEKERDPENYKKSPRARLLARVYRAISLEIPADPQHASYYQGESEGAYRGWKRARPADSYRLFYKYLKEENVIIFAWLNSDVSPNKYKSYLDACRVYHARQKKSWF